MKINNLEKYSNFLFEFEFLFYELWKSVSQESVGNTILKLLCDLQYFDELDDILSYDY